MKLVFSFSILFFATSMHAQHSLAGSWNTGNEHTVIEILQEDGNWMGKIKSSDNNKVEIGKIILKELEKNGDDWTGKLFAAKTQKWMDVTISPQVSQLDLVVSAGFSKKRIQWLKANE